MEMYWKLSVVLPLILTHNALISFAILDPVDFLALQAIRRGMNDLPGSKFFSSWDFTSDPCSFHGVSCEEERVVTLALGESRAGSPGLTGRINPEIGNISSLVEFTIVPGRIMGVLPETLAGLKNLRFLGISRNFISGGIPSSLPATLQTLDLSYNQLQGPIPNLLTNLSIINLIMSHNRFTGSIPPMSGTLKRLDLTHNDLSGSLPSLPPSLLYLSLSQNRLSGPVDLVLTDMNRLNYLDMSANQFNGIIPANVFAFPMRNLQLQRNFFSGVVQPAEEVTIGTVDLSYNRLSGEISPLLSSVPNLYLNNNRFTGRVARRFVDRLLAADLQTLYLQHNYLTGIDINPAEEIPTTTSFCLEYNCMVPPVDTPCPLKAGPQKTRPTTQCAEWRG